MARTFPEQVDVVIVGSGPCGAAYARILSEQAPQAAIACFEAGPLLGDPPGVHVKNIADPAARAAAQRRSEGPRPQGPGTPVDTMEGYASDNPRLVRPGTFLLESGYQQPGEDGLPGAAMSSNVGGMGAHWTAACPRPGDSERISFLAALDELLSEGERLMRVDASPVLLADTEEPLPGTIVGLGWFCAKDIQESDRIEFDEAERDGYGMPAMRIHYKLTDRDRASINRARDAVRHVATALGEPLGSEPLTFPPGASLHYQGTVRMGPADDGTSVCGPACQVWGIGGLYVAGNGVIPTATACNPTLTSVALAVAGARDIAARLAAERN